MTPSILMEIDDCVEATKEKYFSSYYSISDIIMELKTNESIIDIYKPSIMRNVVIFFLNDSENLNLIDFLTGVNVAKYKITFDFKIALKYIVDIDKNKDREDNAILRDTVLRSLKEAINDYEGTFMTDLDKEVLIKNIKLFDMKNNLDFYLNVLGFEITFLILENLRRF